MTPPISLCTDIRLDDLQRIIDLHGSAYAKECGWNASFKAYVAGPLIDWIGYAATTLLYTGLGLAATIAIGYRWRRELWHRAAAANVA